MNRSWASESLDVVYPPRVCSGLVSDPSFVEIESVMEALEGAIAAVQENVIDRNRDYISTNASFSEDFYEWSCA